MSTHPGVSTRPSPSITLAAPAASTALSPSPPATLPTVVMRPPSTATSPTKRWDPVPSTTVAPLMTSSCAMARVSLYLPERARLLELCDAGVVVTEHVAQHSLPVLADGRRLLDRRQVGVEVLERRRQLLRAEPVGWQPGQAVLELRVVDDRLRRVGRADGRVVFAPELHP